MFLDIILSIDRKQGRIPGSQQSFSGSGETKVKVGNRQKTGEERKRRGEHGGRGEDIVKEGEKTKEEEDRRQRKRERTE